MTEIFTPSTVFGYSMASGNSMNPQSSFPEKMSRSNNPPLAKFVTTSKGGPILSVFVRCAGQANAKSSPRQRFEVPLISSASRCPAGSGICFFPAGFSKWYRSPSALDAIGFARRHIF